MPYTYSKTNELENPEYYMYSQYGGIKFLEEYFLDRENFLKLITEEISQGTGIEPQKLYADFQNPSRVIMELLNQSQSTSHNSVHCQLEDLYSSWKNREISREAHKVFLNPKTRGLPLWIIEDVSLCKVNGTIKRIIIAPLFAENSNGSPVTVFAEMAPI